MCRISCYVDFTEINDTRNLFRISKASYYKVIVTETVKLHKYLQTLSQSVVSVAYQRANILQSTSLLETCGDLKNLLSLWDELG